MDTEWTQKISLHHIQREEKKCFRTQLGIEGAKGVGSYLKAVKKVAKNYTDKWEIDNNIKVEFVDGLTINGQAVEGNTKATKYQGKTSKSKQNAIDKKKLQIKKIEDKITMAEGGNAEISDPLDVLKEELSIANNELKNLEKSNVKKARISNITIQIDKNAKNPYATLRAELEHARDIAKGTVPDQNSKHFSRYDGLNEGEVASGYTYKKAQGKAKALNNKKALNNIKENVTQYETEGFSYKTEGGTQYDPANKLYIEKDGKQLGNLSHYVDEDNNLHIEHIVNETQPQNDFAKIHSEPTKGVADRLIEKAIIDNSNVNKIVWDTADSDGARNLLKGFKARHPELADKIVSSEDLAKLTDNNYNKVEGALGNETRDISQGQERYVSETSRDNLSDVGGTSEGTGSKSGKSTSNRDRDIFQGGSRDGGTGRTPNSNISPEQLKLDFTSTEDAITKVVNGEIEPKTIGDIDAIVTKASEIDPVISGNDWKSVAKDSDEFYEKIKDIIDLEDEATIKALFSETDEDITLKDLENFKSYLLKERKVSNATINRYRDALSKIYTLGIFNKLIKENPVKFLKKLRETNYKIRFLTPEEESRMFEILSENAYKALKPMVICALQTGMRRGEIFKLKWDNIDFDYGFIELLETKSGRARRIPLSSKLRITLEEIEKTTDYVFVNPLTQLPYTDIKHSFQSMLKKAKIDNFRFHDLRHTVDTRLATSNIDLVVVKEILGHADIQTTMRYAHAVPKRKLEAIEVLNSYS